MALAPASRAPRRCHRPWRLHEYRRARFQDSPRVCVARVRRVTDASCRNSGTQDGQSGRRRNNLILRRIPDELVHHVLREGLDGSGRVGTATSAGIGVAFHLLGSRDPRTLRDLATRPVQRVYFAGTGVPTDGPMRVVCRATICQPCGPCGRRTSTQRMFKLLSSILPGWPLRKSTTPFASAVSP